MSQVAVVVSPTARCGFPPLWAAVMRFWSKVHREGARSVGNWDDEQLPQRNAANPMETNSPSFSKWRWPLKWKADAFSRERLIFHHWNFFHQHVEWWSSDEPSPSHTSMWEVWNVTAGERRGGIKGSATYPGSPKLWSQDNCITEWLFSNSDFYQSKKFPSSIQFFFLCEKCFCSSGRCSCPALALSSGSCCFVVAVKWVRKAIIKCSLSCSSL